MKENKMMYIYFRYKYTCFGQCKKIKVFNIDIQCRTEQHYKAKYVKGPPPPKPPVSEQQNTFPKKMFPWQGWSKLNC